MRRSINRSHRTTTNCVAFFLVAAVTIIPLSPVFAQTSDSTATPSTDTTSITTAPSPDTQTTTSDTSTASPTTATPTTDSSAASQPATGDTATAPAPSATQSPTPDTLTPAGGLSSGASSQAPIAANSQPPAYTSFNHAALKIDKNTGALTTEFPITIPPGRANLQPDVNLTYNSGDSQLRSIFGEGWSVNIPYIERLNKAGVDKLYSTSTPNYFLSSLDGELATTSVSSTYVPRTENGNFNQYVFSSNSWTVTDKNGTQYTFGSTAGSEQNDPNNTGNVYKWMLTQVRDKNSNYVTYNYFKDAGQIYPSSILYTGNGSTDGIFEIDFLRTSSTDNATSSQTGFAVQSNYRVNEIDAKVNGTWVRKYALAYGTADNGSTTLLTSITQSGRDGLGNVVTLPAVTFSYQGHTAGWTSSSTWASPVVFSLNGADGGSRLMTVTGQELSDLLYGYVDNLSNGHYDAYVNNDHGWTEASSWAATSSPFSNFGSDTGWRLADLDGDGRADLLYGYQDSAWGFFHDAYTNTGYGWMHNASWTPALQFSHFGQDTGSRIADINGDGLPDLIYGYQDSASNVGKDAQINNGHGWTEDTSWNPPVVFSLAGADSGWRVVDVNGDGLADLIYGYVDGSSATHYDAYINNGHGWTEDTSWSPPVLFSNFGSDTGWRIADVNGDGLPDLIYGMGDGSTVHWDAYINNGHGWTENTSWDPPRMFLNLGYDQGNVIGDVNGDGIADIIYGFTDPNNNTTTYGAYINNTTVHPDLLTGVTYSEGGSSSITYKSATLYLDGSGNVSNKAPYPVYVVSQITTNDGSQTATSLAYQYSGGTYYYNNPFDRQFAGFTTVAQTDAAGNVTKTYYHTGNGTDSAHGEYADNFWKIGKPYRVENYDNAGNLYKLTVNKWDTASLGGSAAFVKLAQTTELDYDGLATHADKAETYSYDNTNGNQTQKVQYGQVSASTDGSFTDTGTDDFTTNTNYATSTTGVIGKPYDVTVTNHGGSKVKESRYYYDTLTLGNASLGNLTKEEDWKSGTSYVSTQYAYNGYGLVTQTTDPRSKQTTYSYDTYSLYPATVTNPLSQATQYQYDYSTGKQTQTTDPNGDIFQTAYDGLGRTLQMIQPDANTSSTLVTKTTFAYVDTANAVSVHQADYLSGSATVDTWNYYDGLNRLIQTRKSAEDSGTYKVTDRAYNNIGLLQKESLPYFASGSSKSSPTTTTTLFVSYTYDPLQRVLTIANAVGTASNTYANWKVTATDPRGKAKDLYDDAYGNLIHVDEHNNGSTYSTYYTFDGLKDLTNITDALGNVRNFTYDGLGRRLTAQDLHTSGASSYGTWTYSYDDASNLTQTVDPKSQTVTYAYDDINRVTSESLGGVAQITYTYDSCAQGKTRLCTASSSAAVVSDIYNGPGEIAQETKTVGGTGYTTSYTYDRQSNQLTITNPDNSQVQYTYNLAGLPETVSAKENGGSFATVVSNFDYSPTDQPSAISYANGATQTNTYDSTKIYRLTQKVGTLPGGTNAENFSYTYDADGNITQLVDASASGTGKTVTYTYDDFSRLTNASTTNASSSPYSQSFSYSALGNIASGPSGTYSYAGTGNANPDAVTSIGSTNFSYDLDGNLTSFASTTNTWNYRNRLTQSVNGVTTSTYAYDYQDNRVKLVENSATTILPTRFYNVMSGGLATSTKHIFADGILLATVTKASSTVATRYVLADNLGGANIVTDASGTIAETLDYYPYGKTRIDTKTGSYAGEKRKFIGEEYDSGSGFDYLNARYYDGSRGQFISEDPLFLAVGDPGKVNQLVQQDQSILLADPQSLNPYAYSEDNPIIKSDPTGRCGPICAVGIGLFSTAFFPQRAGGEMDANSNLVPVGSLSNTQIYTGTALASAGLATGEQLWSALSIKQILGILSLGQIIHWSLTGQVTNIDDSFTNSPTDPDLAKFKTVPNAPLELKSGSPVIMPASPNSETPQIDIGHQASGGAGNGGESGSSNFAGQNPTLTYAFNHGVNIYGQTLNQVFSQAENKNSTAK